MKLIKPSFKILDQENNLDGIYKQIELAGRTCYKSEDKITNASAKEFVDRMITNGHGAMLEFGTVYLEINAAKYDSYFNHDPYLWNSFIEKYKNNKYSVVKSSG